MLSNSKKLVVLTAGVLTLSGARAHAGTETFSASTSVQLANTSDYTETLSLSQFNPTVGHLTGVTLTYEEFASDAGTVTNTDHLKTLTYSYTTTTSLTGPGFLSLIPADTTATDAGSFSLAPFAPAKTVNSITPNGPNTQSYGALSGVQGTGSLDFVFTLGGNGSTAGTNHYTGSVDGDGSGSVSITYDYSPIPEASTLLGLGGLLGVGGLQLRRLMRKRA